MVTKGNGKLCGATRLDGGQCRGPDIGRGFCFAHDPQLVEARRLARLKGGQGKSRAVRLGKLAHPRLTAVADALEKALGEVHDGAISPPQAGAMAAVASALLKIATAGDLEERLRRLEEGHPDPGLPKG